jgi:diaminohydroxyphosphoribosylaminopyrimidine deaminase/5-amino-6-(5-phosphoribosylamino)uracil reductase
MTEAHAMERAIALAWRGWGRVAPNPLVGCVLLRDGQVVGEGWHAEFGGWHAERMALEQAGEQARGATAVVTLEPCNHQGKQPPCTEALVAAGVARVVIAVTDPDPEARGGVRHLAAAGITVATGVGAEAAASQLAPFLHRYREPSRPWIVLKLAMSLDGRIADVAGHSRWISGEESRSWVHWLRAGMDAIAVGGATVRRDNPRLTVRGDVTPRIPPRRVVFLGRGALFSDSAVLDGEAGKPAIVVVPPGHGDAEELAAMNLELVTAGSLPEAMEQLRRLGIGSLLVEGGGRLAGSLLAHNLVDRCCLIQAPIFLGASGVPAVAGWTGAPLDSTAPWRVVERRVLGRDSLIVVDRE